MCLKTILQSKLLCIFQPIAPVEIQDAIQENAKCPKC
jgi:hypothetical protein